MRILNLATIMLLALAPLQSHGEEIYKWVDENGKVHFGQARPTGRVAETIQVKTKAAAETGAGRDADAAQGKGDIEKPKAKDERQTNVSPEQQSAMDKMRKNNCEMARANLNALEQDANVLLIDETGNKVKLDAAMKKAKLEETRKQIQKDCQ